MLPSVPLLVLATGAALLISLLSHGVQESVNKSAASAASLDYVKFQAVIKSAASAASRESREGSSRGVPRGRRLPAEPSPERFLGLGFLDLTFGEAALAVDLSTA